VDAAAEGEGRDQCSLGECPIKVAGRRTAAPRADGELSRLVVLCLDGTESADDVDRRSRADRIEQVSPEPP
jgi:hypothetical protein